MKFMAPIGIRAGWASASGLGTLISILSSSSGGGSSSDCGSLNPSGGRRHAHTPWDSVAVFSGLAKSSGSGNFSSCVTGHVVAA